MQTISRTPKIFFFFFFFDYSICWDLKTHRITMRRGLCRYGIGMISQKQQYHHYQKYIMAWHMNWIENRFSLPSFASAWSFICRRQFQNSEGGCGCIPAKLLLALILPRKQYALCISSSLSNISKIYGFPSNFIFPCHFWLISFFIM